MSQQKARGLFVSFFSCLDARKEAKENQGVRDAGRFCRMPDRSLTVYGAAEALEGLAEDGAGGADVDAHMAFATGAEHLTVVEGEVGAADEEVDEGVVIEVEAAAVEPDEEGGFGTQRADGG